MHMHTESVNGPRVFCLTIAVTNLSAGDGRSELPPTKRRMHKPKARTVAIMDSFFPVRRRKSTVLSLGVKREKNAALLNAFIDNIIQRAELFFVPNKTTPESARMQSSPEESQSLFSRA
jgi:hypothetical protein